MRLVWLFCLLLLSGCSSWKKDISVTGPSPIRKYIGQYVEFEAVVALTEVCDYGPVGERTYWRKQYVFKLTDSPFGSIGGESSGIVLPLGKKIKLSGVVHDMGDYCKIYSLRPIK